MKIVILSDTHNNSSILEKAIIQIKALNPDVVIHCGDIINPSILDIFTGLNLKFVFGNNDINKQALRKKANKLGFDEPKDSLDITIDKKKFFVTHEPSNCANAINSQDYDYILHGHTHSPKDEIIGKTRIINPGALHRAHYHTFALLDLENDKLDFYKI